MTLILTLLTDNYLLQVSDRRVTWITPAGSTPRVPDEAINKAIWIDGQTAFAFTGLAKINGESSAMWFAKRLGMHGNLGVWERLKEVTKELSSTFASMKHLPPLLKRHAYVGVGWANNLGPLRPAYLMVSNFHDRRGGQLAKPEDRFEAKAFVMTPSRRPNAILFFAGAQPPKEEWLRFRRLIRNLVRRGVPADRNATMLALFVNQISKVNTTVGPYTMWSFLPRDPLDEGSIVASMPLDRWCTFGYLDPTTMTFDIRSPIFVGGGVVMTNLSAGPLP